MLINDKDATSRLESPLNLINRLKNISSRKSAMSLFGVGRSAEKVEKIEEVKITFNPFENKKLEIIPQVLPQVFPLQQTTTKLDDILENNDSQIKLGLAHDKALDLLNRSVEALSAKLDDVRADKLSAVISAASKTVESIRKERSEASKNNKDREVHYHFYTPEQKKISDYEIIDVGAASA